MKSNIKKIIDLHMVQGGRPVAARLQAALALLEKLRGDPSLVLSDHLASKGSSGLRSHETFGDQAHERFGLTPINKNHGRRSSNLQDWGQSLLDLLESEAFTSATDQVRARLITTAQEPIAEIVRSVLEQEPLIVRTRGRTAEQVVRDVLKQADEKGKSGDVCQYLVGAKLRLRFGREIPIHAANKADRKSRSDRAARLGDYEMENAVIEVAAGLPDEKHITQILDALEVAETEVWLLTRDDRVDTWRKELNKLEDVDVNRVVVTSVESFVGQNISELGEFSSKGKRTQLTALFELYNTYWIEPLSLPGIRIELR